MIRASVTLALTALAVATVAVAQTSPQIRADQPQPSSDQSTGTSETNKADKQALMNVCISQVRVSNPSVSEKDIRDFCDKQVKRFWP